MRILIFSELFYPHGGGAELATWLYSRLLAEEGFEVTVVTKQFPNETSAELLGDRISMFRIPMKVTFGSRYDTVANVGILASSFINKLIAKNDVVYIPCGWYSAIPIAKIHKKPVVVHLHNYSMVCPTSLMFDFVKQEVGSSSRRSFILHEIVEKKRKPLHVVASSLMNDFLGKYYNRLSMLADALIFVSNAQMNLVLSKVPSCKKKSYIIYNPIPNHPLIKAEKKGVGYFGGKSFAKGFNIFMQSLKSLRQSNVEAYLTMTSEEQKVARVGNGILVNFLPKVDPKDLMKKLSVVVIPSLYPEPSPYMLVESLIYGKLIIASDVGGIPEIVDKIESGVKLVKPGDYQEITDALLSFLAFELEETNEIVIKNRERILKRFDNEKPITSFIDLLNKIISSP